MHAVFGYACWQLTPSSDWLNPERDRANNPLEKSLHCTEWLRHGSHRNSQHFSGSCHPVFELQLWWVHALWEASSMIRFSRRRTAASHQTVRYYWVIYVRASPRMLGGPLLSHCSSTLQFLCGGWRRQHDPHSVVLVACSSLMHAQNFLRRVFLLSRG